MNFLSSEVAIVSGAAYASANTTDVTSAAIDLSGYEGALCIAKYGTAAADNLLHAQQSSDDAATDAYSDLEGTGLGVGASDEIQFLDIKNPGKRYVKFIANRGTSSTLEFMIVLKYGPRVLPVDNTTAGTIHGEAHRSPAEGTA